MKTGRCVLTGVVSALCPSGWRLAWPLSQFPPWLMHSFRWTGIFGSSSFTNSPPSKITLGSRALLSNCRKDTETTLSLNTVRGCRLSFVSSYEDSNFQHCVWRRSQQPSSSQLYATPFPRPDVQIMVTELSVKRLFLLNTYQSRLPPQRQNMKLS